ncbi:protease Do-like 10, mitochondrial [Stylophora pistillata]|uniref:Protease Do-like 10, mitochondrial n=1 Tax=Stylophora pistillata TaxID=50429 RepID=A0A2B4S4L5_STYPI|nr:protease Do-like 10, mitochondrial [Stylophora pistillata]PFX23537.1 Protease Do-like 10, mitochondrial [Stylophora pistillata]
MSEKHFGSHLKTSEKVLKSVVKLFVQISTPNYSMPWQMKRQQQVFGSGFVISGRRILTNGHVVAYQKSVRVRKHGDAKKYNAHVIHVGHECDIAMLGVVDETFWEDLCPLEFGEIPALEEDVVCVGFPTGGDNISVTRGVVSRVEIQRYAHSAVELLAIQIDAAINSGNSGGPALQDDKVIGIAFETLDNAENIGYIIPVTVIKHFLGDIEKSSTYNGFCRLGIKWQPIESEHMRHYFQLSAEQTGVLVTKVLPLFSCSSVLKRGDVLMAVDEEVIADNGTVHFRGNERILFDYKLSQMFIGEICKLKILRQGHVIQVEVTLDLITSLVPTQLYDKRPSYLVYAGLVFVSLSQPYMQHQYGKDWARKAPIRLCDRVLYGILNQTGQEVILLSQVLASELTTGYETMANLQLFKVNGRPILNLKHLASVLDEITKPFSKPQDSQAKGETTVRTVTSESSVEDNSNTKQGELTVKSCEIHKRHNDNIVPLKEITTIDDTDGRSCAKLKTLEDVKKNSERGSSVCEIDVHPMSLYRTTSKGCRKQDFTQTDLRSSDALYLSTTQATDMTSGVDDDPTLLNREDFVHFELDKDKIIVLHIPTAYNSAPEILQQYAIGQSRSNDLPPPP